MAELEFDPTAEEQIRRIMDELGVSRDAARLYLTIQSGYALVNDRVSLGPDEPLDPDLEADLARWHEARRSGRTT